jgi:hypothetical protein
MADKASKSRDNGMVNENRDKISGYFYIWIVSGQYLFKISNYLVIFRSCQYG